MVNNLDNPERINITLTSHDIVADLYLERLKLVENEKYWLKKEHGGIVSVYNQNKVVGVVDNKRIKIFYTSKENLSAVCEFKKDLKENSIFYTEDSESKERILRTLRFNVTSSLKDIEDILKN
ncbi:MAG: hypothetical protein AABW81_02480 [Nanoarchaeota archaeon]